MRTVPVILLGVLLGAPAETQAQTRPFDEVLPASTVAALVVDDSTRLRADLLTSATGRLWSDPASAAMRAQVDAEFTSWAEEARDGLGVDPFGLLAMVSGQVGLALLELPELPGEPQVTPLAGALLIDVGGSAEAFEEGLDALLERAAEDPGLVLKNETIHDLPCVVLMREDDDGVRFHTVMVDGVLVALFSSPASDAELHLGRLIEGLRGEGGEALADAPRYRASTASRGAQAATGVRMFADLEPVVALGMAKARAEDPDGEEQAVVDALRISALRSMSVMAWIEEGRTFVRGALEVAGAEGLFGVAASLIDRQRCTPFKYLPPGVDDAWAANLDLVSGADAILELVSAIDPQAGAEAITGMAEMAAALGFHPLDDLLPLLDGQLGFFSALAPAGEGLAMAGLDTNFGLVAGLTDGPRLRQILDDLIRAQGLHAARQREEFEGYDLYVIPMGFFNLAYAVLDDLLVMSGSPGLVQDVLRRRGNPDLAALDGAAPYRNLRNLLGADETLLHYSEPGSGLKALLAVLRQLQATGALPGLDGDALQLEPGFQARLAALPLPGDDLVERVVTEGTVWTVVLEDGGGLRWSLASP